MNELKGFLIDKPFFVKAVVLLFLASAGMLLLSAVALLASFVFFPEMDLLNPELTVQYQIQHIEATMFIQVASQICFMLLPAIAFGYLMSKDTKSYFKADSFPSFRTILLSFLVLFLGGIVTQSLLEINHMIDIPDYFLGYDLRPLEKQFDHWQSLNEGLMKGFFKDKRPAIMLSAFFMIAIVPAVAEEFMFRGVIQQLVTEGKTHVFTGILVTSITFALIHFQFYNFLGLTFMGMVLGYLFYYTGNIWLPIIGHFLNNGLQVIMIYLHEFDLIELNIDEVEHMPYWISLLAFIAMIFLLRQLKKESKQEFEGLG